VVVIGITTDSEVDDRNVVVVVLDEIVGVVIFGRRDIVFVD
jgi:hypothetical protein